MWSRFEPDVFAESEARLSAEITRRYGVDAAAIGADCLADAQDLQRATDAERVREREHQEAADAAVERDDELGAAIVMAGVDSDVDHDLERGRAAGHGHAADALEVDANGVAYDSEARRAAFAQRAAAAGVEPDAVHARVVASNANGKPGRQATSAKSRRAAKAPAPKVAAAREQCLER